MSQVTDTSENHDNALVLLLSEMMKKKYYIIIAICFVSLLSYFYAFYKTYDYQATLLIYENNDNYYDKGNSENSINSIYLKWLAELISVNSKNDYFPISSDKILKQTMSILNSNNELLNTKFENDIKNILDSSVVNSETISSERSKIKILPVELNFQLTQKLSMPVYKIVYETDLFSDGEDLEKVLINLLNNAEQLLNENIMNEINNLIKVEEKRIDSELKNLKIKVQVEIANHKISLKRKKTLLENSLSIAKELNIYEFHPEAFRERDIEFYFDEATILDYSNYYLRGVNAIESEIKTVKSELDLINNGDYSSIKSIDSYNKLIHEINLKNVTADFKLLYDQIKLGNYGLKTYEYVKNSTSVELIGLSKYQLVLLGALLGLFLATAATYVLLITKRIESQKAIINA